MLATYAAGMLINGGIIIRLWRRFDPSRERRWFTIMAAAVICMMAMDLGRALAPNETLWIAFYTTKSLFQWSTTVSMLVFALIYTNRTDLLDRLSVKAYLFAVPVTALIIVFTNPIHHWVWTAYAPAEPTVLYSILLAIGYTYPTIAAGFIVSTILQSRRTTRRQLIGLVAGFLAGSAAHFTQVLSIGPNFGSGYAVGGTAMTVAIAFTLFRENMLQATPVTLDRILDTVEDGIIVITGGEYITDYNEAAADILPEISTRTRLDDVAPELRDGDEYVDVLELGDAGEEQYVVDISRFSRDGEEAGRVISLRDVTRVRRAEHQLEHESEQLEELASFVSHDLRNPLTVAKTYASDLENDVEDDRLEMINDSLDRMEEMIDDALTFARQGSTIEDPEFVALDALAQEAWVMSDTREATLDLTFQDTEAYCDGPRLQSLLENVFRNAVDHGPDDVTVRIGLLDDGDGFYVEDDGPGFPDDIDVFEKGATTADEGTGLGLAIVESIASAHDWQVQTTASDVGGARVEFRSVPLRRDSAPASTATAA